ncbi:phage holin family protein [Streptomyces sp. HB2AG]|uniref:phage holin family protein n=1 Tax=Streptomyces sp. HB2AG TaxID=2983400 RepID=UPI0022AAF576|nr:phage holin family protein [Streptomyces sp. HB2AG]MCZ2526181.1 phage holin family protein [Streptomyces sp. HB2AG]
MERWQAAGRALLHMLVVWAVGTVTIAVLAGILPDFRLQSADGDDFTRIGAAAALAAGAFGLLNALVWPLLVRALLLVPAIVLALLVYLLNGVMLLLAVRLVPDWRGEIDPPTAVLIAAVVSAACSAASGTLALRDDEAYRRRLARLAGRRTGRRARRGADAAAPQPPGTVFLQLDGVGHDVLLRAVRDPARTPVRGPARADRDTPPLMPTVASWLAGGTHRLVPWRTDWSSQTGASQLGILHGSNFDVPAFRWYEKETGRIVVCNSPSDAAELERRARSRPGARGLLEEDGASRGNLFGGGASQLALVLSAAARRDRRTRSRHGYFAYFSDPAHAVRTTGSFLAEVVREVWQSTRARLRGDRPRVPRGGLYPLVRAFATVVERDVVVAAVLGDMLAGRSTVYADLVAYDEVAHHSGVDSEDARQVLARLDRSIRLIARAAEHAPRPYRFVLLSDHGQSHGETFAARYGVSLRELVLSCCGLPAGGRRARHRRHRPARLTARDRTEYGIEAEAAREEIAGAEAREAARAALHRPERAPAVHPPADRPIVLGSGNLGLVSFPDIPGRATRERIERAHPGLLGVLAGHPGVGFLLVATEDERGSVVLGAGGAEHWIATGEVVGKDPLAPFGEGAVEAVRRTDAFPHVADIMVNSACDPLTGEVHAFEAQIGSHGGLGGGQSRAFLLHPADLPAPPRPLAGAEAVHTVLRGWLEESVGPQVPVAGRNPAA